MGSSVLLQVARDSIKEVLQAKRIIKKQELYDTYPILLEPINCSVTTYINKQKRSFYKTNTSQPLLENIILCAKKAVFEDPQSSPLIISEYLHCELQLTLYTKDEELSEIDPPLFKEEEKILFY